MIAASCVIVLDAAATAITRGRITSGKQLLGARDLKAHVLLDGDAFDLGSRAVQGTSVAAAEARPHGQAAPAITPLR